MKSKIISLSAISAGFIAISLTLGAYIEFIDIVAVVLTAVFVIMPLYYNSYLGSFLSYLAGGVIAFMLSGFNLYSIVFPSYFGFFGVFPIIKFLMAEKRVNKILAYIVGMVWCVAVFYGVFFYYTMFMGQVLEGLPVWMTEYILYIAVGLFGVISYVVFDRFYLVSKQLVDRYLRRIIK